MFSLKKKKKLSEAKLFTLISNNDLYLNELIKYIKEFGRLQMPERNVLSAHLSKLIFPKNMKQIQSRKQ